MSRRLLSISEFCSRTKTGRSTAYKLFASGAVKVVKLGTRTLIPEEEIDRFIEGLPQALEVGAIRRTVEVSSN